MSNLFSYQTIISMLLNPKYRFLDISDISEKTRYSSVKALNDDFNMWIPEHHNWTPTPPKQRRINRFLDSDENYLRISELPVDHPDVHLYFSLPKVDPSTFDSCIEW
eukprot:gb/GECH01011472.1/.p1 GENE.gb/GECH01011472.1/~~gb/GECH01011472.1/.p1  ORF type:complete len:107 (+),score=15.18 gb/GECH01011472.1/:1-321(+)